MKANSHNGSDRFFPWQGTRLEINNPTILPEELIARVIILNISAQDEAQRQYDLEMHVQRYGLYP